MDKNVYRHQLKGVIEFRYVADKEQKKEKRMTDNELLLAISSMMDERFDRVYARMDKMDSRMDQMDNRISEMDSRLEQKIENIRIHLENETDKKIQLLAENYVPAAKRYEQQSEKNEDMRNDIELLKKVVREHTERLERLDKLA